MSSFFYTNYYIEFCEYSDANRRVDTNTKGTPTQKIDVGIEDESGEAILTLFGRMMFSALKDWDPSNTILLITKPNCWPGSSKLTVSARTMIEVDPLGLGEEVEWLRRLAGWSGAGVNERFPEGGLFYLILEREKEGGHAERANSFRCPSGGRGHYEGEIYAC